MEERWRMDGALSFSSTFPQLYNVHITHNCSRWGRTSCCCLTAVWSTPKYSKCRVHLNKYIYIYGQLWLRGRASALLGEGRWFNSPGLKISKCPWARYWTPNFSWCAGQKASDECRLFLHVPSFRKLKHVLLSITRCFSTQRESGRSSNQHYHFNIKSYYKQNDKTQHINTAEKKTGHATWTWLQNGHWIFTHSTHQRPVSFWLKLGVSFSVNATDKMKNLWNPKRSHYGCSNVPRVFTGPGATLSPSTCIQVLSSVYEPFQQSSELWLYLSLCSWRRYRRHQQFM